MPCFLRIVGNSSARCMISDGGSNHFSKVNRKNAAPVGV